MSHLKLGLRLEDPILVLVDLQKEQRERAKDKIAEAALALELEREKATLKARKDEEIKQNRIKKEEERLAEIRRRGLDMWDLR